MFVHIFIVSERVNIIMFAFGTSCVSLINEEDTVLQWSGSTPNSKEG